MNFSTPLFLYLFPFMYGIIQFMIVLGVVITYNITCFSSLVILQYISLQSKCRYIRACLYMYVYVNIYMVYIGSKAWDNLFVLDSCFTLPFNALIGFARWSVNTVIHISCHYHVMQWVLHILATDIYITLERLCSIDKWQHQSHIHIFT